jgi:hypothetical protein
MSKEPPDFFDKLPPELKKQVEAIRNSTEVTKPLVPNVKKPDDPSGPARGRSK